MTPNAKRLRQYQPSYQTFGAQDHVIYVAFCRVGNTFCFSFQPGIAVLSLIIILSQVSIADQL